MSDAGSQASFRLGFVGGAPNSAAGYAHFAACRLDARWQLVAGCFSRNNAINSEAAALYGVDKARTYCEFDKFLSREAGSLDAVAILAPTPLHKEMVIKCLEAGVPVICEKSLALTSAEAKEIEKARAAKNGFLAVVYNYSGYPIVRELRRMIRSGELGDLIHFEAEMPQEGFLRTDRAGNKPDVQKWRLEDGLIPTLHLDLAVHLHELLYYLTGSRPSEVVADQASHGWFDVIDDVHCLCRNTGNLRGHVWFSKSALGARNGLRLRIYGTKASAEWLQANPEELLVSFSDGRRQTFDRGMGLPVASQARYARFKAGHPAGFIEALGNLYADIHGALAHYKKTGHQESEEVFGAALAIEGMQWLEAMVKSCSTGKWEQVTCGEPARST